ncbi:Homeobox protein MOX-1 [Willisornis vidua]|uniref:Homeobox protein MOX-1 n=1 Tax=Willisornis vidua TaxID=1566151 RepID=A0ABQ9DLJ8_9PASS|nr:Homeobox protein MOX-1 [Willisornis vidua]
MDPTSSSCMRSPQPPPALWGCTRNTHMDVTTAPGLNHCPAAPFSFHQRPDLAAYSDFSASCLLTAPYSFPPEERALVESHHSFQHPDWHLATTETRRQLHPEQALASEESKGSSPDLVSVEVSVDEGEDVPVNTTNDTEKKPSKRKKESSGFLYDIYQFAWQSSMNPTPSGAPFRKCLILQMDNKLLHVTEHRVPSGKTYLAKHQN